MLLRAQSNNKLKIPPSFMFYQENYEMATLSRIGKEKVLNHHHEVPYKVLEKQYTFGDEKNENKIIHWDNLEALKSLLPEYEGKIKCIYIDPPYNTGNEGRVYNDNVSHPKIKKWLHQVVGKEWEDLSRHDKWLCMMYPRLKLLHKLLKEDGVIFISIDDNEQANLKLMMDEIFGSGNFIWDFIWKARSWKWWTTWFIAEIHEHVLFFSKDIKKVQIKWDIRIWKERKEQLRQRWQWDKREDRPSMFFPIYTPEWIEVLPIKDDWTEWRWRVWRVKMDELRNQWLIEFKQNNWRWQAYRIYEEWNITETAVDSIISWVWTASNWTILLKEIFWDKVFDTAKPVDLLEYLIWLVSNNKTDIILDSFSWSWTTAHAVLNLNKQDGWNRKFILIEMEDYAETITAERVKRVINGYGEDTKRTEWTGWGFEYYELGQPLFLDEENLNEAVGEDKLREYIWYTETKTPFTEPKKKNKYFLGTNHDADFYFFYEKNKATTLNYEFLSSLETKKNKQFVIYADLCLLSEEFMRKHNIIFKKIPRDITKF